MSETRSIPKTAYVEPVDANGDMLRVGDRVRSTADFGPETVEGVVAAAGKVRTGILNGVRVRDAAGAEHGSAAFLWEKMDAKADLPPGSLI